MKQITRLSIAKHQCNYNYAKPCFTIPGLIHLEMMSMSPAPKSTTGSPHPHSTRLSADDWARAALELIAEQGVAAVAVEPLARRLGVTKGSFYWHFRSRDALLQAAIERWEQEDQKVNFIPLHKRVKG